MVCIFLLGSTNSYSQGSTFIIKLKSGAEIETKEYVIENDIVYYRFYHGKNIVGINKSDVAEIVEHIESIELNPTPTKVPPQTIDEATAKDMDIEKALARYGYLITKEEEKKEKQIPLCEMEEDKEYPDLEGNEWVLVVEGVIIKKGEYEKKEQANIIAQFEDEHNKTVLRKTILPASMLREMKVGEARDVRVDIPLEKKGRRCVIKRTIKE
jgi:hypothetical protein